MKPYLKIYKLFLKTSLMVESQYRVNFFLLVLVNLGWASVYIFFYVFIFQHIDQVGDWTYERSLVLAATFLLARALNSFLFKQNLTKLASIVYKGDLDLILTKPLSSQFYVSLRQFYLRPLLRFFLGWLVLIVVLTQTGIKISLFSFLNYLLALALSCLIVYSLWFMSCCLVFWLGNIENISQFFHPILRTTALPYDILPGILKEVFFFVIPLAFVSTVPAKALLDLASWPSLIYGFFISLVLLFLSSKLWNFALTRYSSASS